MAGEDQGRVAGETERQRLGTSIILFPCETYTNIAFRHRAGFEPPPPSARNLLRKIDQSYLFKGGPLSFAM